MMSSNSNTTHESENNSFVDVEIISEIVQKKQEIIDVLDAEVLVHTEEISKVEEIIIIDDDKKVENNPVVKLTLPISDKKKNSNAEPQIVKSVNSLTSPISDWEESSQTQSHVDADNKLTSPISDWEEIIELESQVGESVTKLTSPVSSDCEEILQSSIHVVDSVNSSVTLSESANRMNEDVIMVCDKSAVNESILANNNSETSSSESGISDKSSSSVVCISAEGVEVEDKAEIYNTSVVEESNALTISGCSESENLQSEEVLKTKNVFDSYFNSRCRKKCHKKKFYIVKKKKSKYKKNNSEKNIKLEKLSGNKTKKKFNIENFIKHSQKQIIESNNSMSLKRLKLNKLEKRKNKKDKHKNTNVTAVSGLDTNDRPRSSVLSSPSGTYLKNMDLKKSFHSLPKESSKKLILSNCTKINHSGINKNVNLEKNNSKELKDGKFLKHIDMFNPEIYRKSMVKIKNNEVVKTGHATEKKIKDLDSENRYIDPAESKHQSSENIKDNKSYLDTNNILRCIEFVNSENKTYISENTKLIESEAFLKEVKIPLRDIFKLNPTQFHKMCNIQYPVAISYKVLKKLLKYNEHMSKYNFVKKLALKTESQMHCYKKRKKSENVQCLKLLKHLTATKYNYKNSYYYYTRNKVISDRTYANTPSTSNSSESFSLQLKDKNLIVQRDSLEDSTIKEKEDSETFEQNVQLESYIYSSSIRQKERDDSNACTSGKRLIVTIKTPIPHKSIVPKKLNMVRCNRIKRQVTVKAIINTDLPVEKFVKSAAHLLRKCKNFVHMTVPPKGANAKRTMLYKTISMTNNAVYPSTNDKAQYLMPTQNEREVNNKDINSTMYLKNESESVINAGKNSLVCDQNYFEKLDKSVAIISPNLEKNLIVSGQNFVEKAGNSSLAVFSSLRENALICDKNYNKKTLDSSTSLISNSENPQRVDQNNMEIRVKTVPVVSTQLENTQETDKNVVDNSKVNQKNIHVAENFLGNEYLANFQSLPLEISQKYNGLNIESGKKEDCQNLKKVIRDSDYSTSLNFLLPATSFNFASSLQNGLTSHPAQKETEIKKCSDALNFSEQPASSQQNYECDIDFNHFENVVNKFRNMDDCKNRQSILINPNDIKKSKVSANNLEKKPKIHKKLDKMSKQCFKSIFDVVLQKYPSENSVSNGINTFSSTSVSLNRNLVKNNNENMGHISQKLEKNSKIGEKSTNYNTSSDTKLKVNYKVIFDAVLQKCSKNGNSDRNCSSEAYSMAPQSQPKVTASCIRDRETMKVVIQNNEKVSEISNDVGFCTEGKQNLKSVTSDQPISNTFVLTKENYRISQVSSENLIPAAQVDERVSKGLVKREKADSKISKPVVQISSKEDQILEAFQNSKTGHKISEKVQTFEIANGISEIVDITKRVDKCIPVEANGKIKILGKAQTFAVTTEEIVEAMNQVSANRIHNKEKLITEILEVKKLNENSGGSLQIFEPFEHACKAADQIQKTVKKVCDSVYQNVEVKEQISVEIEKETNDRITEEVEQIQPERDNLGAVDKINADNRVMKDLELSEDDRISEASDQEISEAFDQTFNNKEQTLSVDENSQTCSKTNHDQFIKADRQIKSYDHMLSDKVTKDFEEILISEIHDQSDAVPQNKTVDSASKNGEKTLLDQNLKVADQHKSIEVSSQISESSDQNFELIDKKLKSVAQLSSQILDSFQESIEKIDQNLESVEHLPSQISDSSHQNLQLINQKLKSVDQLCSQILDSSQENIETIDQNLESVEHLSIQISDSSHQNLETANQNANSVEQLSSQISGSSQQNLKSTDGNINGFDDQVSSQVSDLSHENVESVDQLSSQISDSSRQNLESMEQLSSQILDSAHRNPESVEQFSSQSSDSGHQNIETTDHNLESVEQLSSHSSHQIPKSVKQFSLQISGSGHQNIETTDLNLEAAEQLCSQISDSSHQNLESMEQISLQTFSDFEQVSSTNSANSKNTCLNTEILSSEIKDVHENDTEIKKNKVSERESVIVKESLQQASIDELVTEKARSNTKLKEEELKVIRDLKGTDSKRIFKQELNVVDVTQEANPVEFYLEKNNKKVLGSEEINEDNVCKSEEMKKVVESEEKVTVSNLKEEKTRMVLDSVPIKMDEKLFDKTTVDNRLDLVLLERDKKMLDAGVTEENKKVLDVVSIKGNINMLDIVENKEASNSVPANENIKILFEEKEIVLDAVLEKNSGNTLDLEGKRMVDLEKEKSTVVESKEKVDVSNNKLLSPACNVLSNILNTSCSINEEVSVDAFVSIKEIDFHSFTKKLQFSVPKNETNCLINDLEALKADFSYKITSKALFENEILKCNEKHFDKYVEKIFLCAEERDVLNLLRNQEIANIFRPNLHINFGVISQDKNSAELILYRNYLFILHHSAILDENFCKFLDWIYEKILSSKDSLDYLLLAPATSFNLWTFMLSSLNSKDVTEKKKIFCRNLNALNRLSSSGYFYLLPKLESEKIGPNVPLYKIRDRLPVLHKKFSFAYRHFVCLIGSKLKAAKCYENFLAKEEIHRIETVSAFLRFASL